MLYRLNNIKFQMLTQVILQYYKLVKDLKISCHLTVTAYCLHRFRLGRKLYHYIIVLLVVFTAVQVTCLLVCWYVGCHLFHSIHCEVLDSHCDNCKDYGVPDCDPM